MTEEQGKIAREAMNHLDNTNNRTRNMILATEGMIRIAKKILANDTDDTLGNGTLEEPSLKTILTDSISLMEGSQEALHGVLTTGETLKELLLTYNENGHPYGF